jgi:putative ABC transport system substrate-binding protein
VPSTLLTLAGRWLNETPRITLLGAAAWLLAARAQQGERMRRVGVLANATAGEPEAQSWVAAFQQGMQEFGWSVGRLALRR